MATKASNNTKKTNTKKTVVQTKQKKETITIPKTAVALKEEHGQEKKRTSAPKGLVSKKNTSNHPAAAQAQASKPKGNYSSSNKSDNDGAISKYLKEIDRIKLLTREEETALAIASTQGDIDAKNKLIQSNLRFVVNIAKKYQNRGLPLLDLISEGNMGLITAADKFDPERGYHFISYAVWWIKQSILKAISEKTRLIRLPLNRANQLIQIERLRKEVSTENQGNISADMICDKMKISKDSVVDILSASRDYVSLETPVVQNKREKVLSEIIEDSTISRPEKSVIDKSLSETIENILASLSLKEQTVIRYRYGLSGTDAMSLKEIGKKENLTKERIRQIEKKTLKKLQTHASRRKALFPFLNSVD